jgi:hypothetical protein
VVRIRPAVTYVLKKKSCIFFPYGAENFMLLRDVLARVLAGWYRLQRITLYAGWVSVQLLGK